MTALADGFVARANRELLAELPGPRRALLEIALLSAIMFTDVFVASPTVVMALVATELGLALALARPWARGSAIGRVLGTLLVVLAVVAPSTIAHPSVSGPTRRLGVEILRVAPGDAPGGVVEVRSVARGTPADGVLRVGDRVMALGGTPLGAADPAGDLARRARSDELPEDTTVTVLRDAERVDLPIRVPRIAGARAGFGRWLFSVRDISSRHLVVAAALRGALLIALIVFLTRADGQGMAAIGIARDGWVAELVAAIWMTAGCFVVQIAFAIPISIVGALTGILKRETAQRTETLGAIAAQGSVLEFAAAAVVAAAFEELMFRGFLTPRVRSLTGSWPIAIAAVSVAFGLGHAYEGVLAMAQTAVLGAYFSILFVLRRRLAGIALAHAAYNIVMLLIARLVLNSGALERLRELTPK